MLKYEKDYIDGLKYILEEGKWVKNKRTGVECLTVPFMDFTYKPEDIPLLTVKQCFPVSSWAERLGYWRRYNDAQQYADIGSPTWLKDANKPSWQSNPNCKGINDMGAVYGAAVPEDEITNLLHKIAMHEDDRGLILNFWKPELFENGCLRPCLFQTTYTILDGQLHTRAMQRSLDYTLGKPFNAFSLWVENKILSKISGLEQGTVKHNINNAHIYAPHIEGVYEMLERTPLGIKPTVEVKPDIKMMSDITLSDCHAREYFSLTGYEHLGKIGFEMITD